MKNNPFDTTPYTLKWIDDKQYEIIFKGNLCFGKGEARPSLAQAIINLANDAYKRGLTDRLTIKIEEI